jgi:hypothetical protein
MFLINWYKNIFLVQFKVHTVVAKFQFYSLSRRTHCMQMFNLEVKTEKKHQKLIFHFQFFIVLPKFLIPIKKYQG